MLILCNLLLCQNRAQPVVGEQVAAESKMTVDVEEYVSSFRTDLCDVLAAWSRGAKFAEIMKMTDVFEVNPTRCIPPNLGTTTGT